MACGTRLSLFTRRSLLLCRQQGGQAVPQLRQLFCDGGLGGTWACRPLAQPPLLAAGGSAQAAWCGRRRPFPCGVVAFSSSSSSSSSAAGGVEQAAAAPLRKPRPSKSAAKREVQGLQKLAAQLCRLSDRQLERLRPLLDERAVDAILEAKGIPGRNQARGRQERLVAKLLREGLEDEAAGRLLEVGLAGGLVLRAVERPGRALGRASQGKRGRALRRHLLPPCATSLGAHCAPAGSGCERGCGAGAGGRPGGGAPRGSVDGGPVGGGSGAWQARARGVVVGCHVQHLRAANSGAPSSCAWSVPALQCAALMAFGATALCATALQGMTAEVFGLPRAGGGVDLQRLRQLVRQAAQGKARQVGTSAVGLAWSSSGRASLCFWVPASGCLQAGAAWGPPRHTLTPWTAGGCCAGSRRGSPGQETGAAAAEGGE